MSMFIPTDLGAVLQEEQRRHLAGELGESREAMEERQRIICPIVFRGYLLDVHSLVDGDELERLHVALMGGRRGGGPRH